MRAEVLAMPLLSVMLIVDFEPRSSSQLATFSNELLRAGWSCAEGNECVYTSQMNDVSSDHQMLQRTTEHVHAAVEAAEVSEWSADCVCSESQLWA